MIHTTLVGLEPTTFRLLVRRATSSATDSPSLLLQDCSRRSTTSGGGNVKRWSCRQLCSPHSLYIDSQQKYFFSLFLQHFYPFNFIRFIVFSFTLRYSNVLHYHGRRARTDRSVDFPLSAYVQDRSGLHQLAVAQVSTISVQIYH